MSSPDFDDDDLSDEEDVQSTRPMNSYSGIPLWSLKVAEDGRIDPERSLLIIDGPSEKAREMYSKKYDAILENVPTEPAFRKLISNAAKVFYAGRDKDKETRVKLLKEQAATGMFSDVIARNILNTDSSEWTRFQLMDFDDVLATPFFQLAGHHQAEITEDAMLCIIYGAYDAYKDYLERASGVNDKLTFREWLVALQAWRVAKQRDVVSREPDLFVIYINECGRHKLENDILYYGPSFYTKPGIPSFRVWKNANTRKNLLAEIALEPMRVETFAGIIPTNPRPNFQSSAILFPSVDDILNRHHQKPMPRHVVTIRSMAKMLEATREMAISDVNDIYDTTNPPKHTSTIVDGMHLVYDENRHCYFLPTGIARIEAVHPRNGERLVGYGMFTPNGVLELFSSMHGMYSDSSNINLAVKFRLADGLDDSPSGIYERAKTVIRIEEAEQKKREEEGQVVQEVEMNSPRLRILMGPPNRGLEYMVIGRFPPSVTSYSTPATVRHPDAIFLTRNPMTFETSFDEERMDSDFHANLQNRLDYLDGITVKDRKNRLFLELEREFTLFNINTTGKRGVRDAPFVWKTSDAGVSVSHNARRKKKAPRRNWVDV